MKTRRAGFTILEIVIVLGIIGIMTGIGIYSMQPPSTGSLWKIEKQRLQEALMRTRNMARSRNECTRAVISGGNKINVNAYAVAVDGTCTSDPAAAATVTLTEFAFRDGVTLADFSVGGSQIIFNPGGSLALKQPITLDMTMIDTAGNNLSARATIYPAVGQIRVR